MPGMSRVFRYYHRVEGVRGSVLGLPYWGRLVLTIVALPGLAAVLLSIAAFLVSLLALLVVTVPVYRLLLALSRGGASPGEARDFVEEAAEYPRGEAKRIDVTVRDTPPDAT